MSGREERPQSSEETQSSPAPITSTAPPATTAGISQGTVARARERIQQQAHSSSPSQTGSTRSRTSQLTSGQTAHPQSLLPGMANMHHQYQNRLTRHCDNSDNHQQDLHTNIVNLSRNSARSIRNIIRITRAQTTKKSRRYSYYSSKCVCHWYLN